eukprot:CAMPEP_0172565428 /NCGR_PEP_ID=MMETSP1067-20121228/108047_1 /TAXON_ID=265564 ORGANISM="Thalassiosira punctigera, Strain Tpunct2005C2" /NCGR_SAMPLE_ID=MMETSP1067 /ASSEMBLY_ACC=CAM_ASM_000444 /LENGTH=333 /DNA_ID=CAMNT_0013356291 /DNA_START=236 /DNA_END=1238 /DNA_ORIENTATION=-
MTVPTAAAATVSRGAIETGETRRPRDLALTHDASSNAFRLRDPSPSAPKSPPRASPPPSCTPPGAGSSNTPNPSREAAERSGNDRHPVPFHELARESPIVDPVRQLPHDVHGAVPPDDLLQRGHGAQYRLATLVQRLDPIVHPPPPGPQRAQRRHLRYSGRADGDRVLRLEHLIVRPRAPAAAIALGAEGDVPHAKTRHGVPLREAEYVDDVLLVEAGKVGSVVVALVVVGVREPVPPSDVEVLVRVVHDEPHSVLPRQTDDLLEERAGERHPRRISGVHQRHHPYRVPPRPRAAAAAVSVPVLLQLGSQPPEVGHALIRRTHEQTLRFLCIG